MAQDELAVEISSIHILFLLLPSPSNYVYFLEDA